MLEWERDSKKKFGQEDQMLKLTFNFHGTLSISNFFENELIVFTKKSKRENKSKRKKKRERKIEVKRGERKERKKEKNLLFERPC